MSPGGDDRGEVQIHAFTGVVLGAVSQGRFFGPYPSSVVIPGGMGMPG